MSLFVPLMRATALVAGVAGATVGLAALIVLALGASAATRGWLGLTFARPAGEVHEAVAIGGGNLRLAGAALVAAGAVQLRPELRLLFDAALGLLAATNLAVVGIALGASGERLLTSIALHGPLELAGFALLGAVYLRARTRDLDARRLLLAGGASTLLLVAAAISETYLKLGVPR